MSQRTPQWIVERRPPRKQTPPTEMLTEPCRKCGLLVLIADVGPGVVRLDPTPHQIADGFRWHPSFREWVSVNPTMHTPNGWPVHSLHECRDLTSQEKEEAA